jgi:predicted transcriptional regulator
VYNIPGQTVNIVAQIIENGQIANKDIPEMFGISHSSVYDELKKLLVFQL